MSYEDPEERDLERIVEAPGLCSAPFFYCAVAAALLLIFKRLRDLERTTKP